MEPPLRRLPVVLAGFAAFLTLFSTQPILPFLAKQFGAGQFLVSLTLTATTAGVAIAAPFAGWVADQIGRKRMIVWSASVLALATLCCAATPGLEWLIVFRFLQGFATPGVFGVAVAYINDEWPREAAGSVVGSYVSGTVVGGFVGRLITGFLAEHVGWRWSFVVPAVLVAAITVVLDRGLPVERVHKVSGERTPIFGPAFSHLTNKRLAATYVAGFCILFTHMATFTYAAFHLADAPFHLRPSQLGMIFTVYLFGAAITPLAGKAIDRYGHVPVLLLASAMSTSGALLSLIPNVWMVILGLTICSSGVFFAQASATSHVGTIATHTRALAVGLYVTFYYVGGSAGSSGPSLIWQRFGWPGCVALVILVQIYLAVTALFAWPATTQREAVEVVA